MIALMLAAAVTCCASEVVQEFTPCEQVADGNPETIWHTPWSGSGPHWVEMRFPERGRVMSCEFTHRPNGVNGTPGSVTIVGDEILSDYPLWPDGPDGSVVVATFDPPMNIAHDDHPLAFHFGNDYNGNKWASLAEIDCHFEPTQEPTVDPPCDNAGFTPTPVFQFDYPEDKWTSASGFGVYVRRAGADEWVLVHAINCGWIVERNEFKWACPTQGFALQRYVTNELGSCEMYMLGISTLGFDGVMSVVATDDINWVWNRIWECESMQHGCAPQ